MVIWKYKFRRPNKSLFYKIAVTIVFIVGALLNYQAIKAPYFIDDDTDILMGVYNINLSLEKLHLPMGHVHGPFTIYITKLSGLLFGENYCGWRVIQVFSTFLILFFIYNVTKKVFGKIAGFFALCLSAFNLFFIFNSKYIGEEIYFLLFNTAALAFFLMILKENKQRYFVITCIMIGLGLLTKITTVWLLLALIVYIILHKNSFSFITRRTLIISCLAIVILPSPYIYWILTDGRFCSLSYLNLFGLHIHQNVLALFIGYFMQPQGASVDYDLGYNILGPIQGLVGILGIFFCMKIRKDKYINLLKVVFLTMFFASLFIFSGEDTEPRHFSPLIVVSIITGSILLTQMWKKSRLWKSFVIVLIFTLLLEAVAYVNKLERYYYSLHSRLSLSAWGMEEKTVDLNDLSKKIISFCLNFNPTLIVFPSKELDSIAHFVTAYSGVRTISTLSVEEHHLRYTVDDMKRIVVFLTPLESPNKFIQWAKTKGYRYYFKEGFIDVSRHTLPIEILLMYENEEDISDDDIKAFKSIVHSNFKDRFRQKL